MARYKKATVKEDLAAGTLTWNFANGRSIVLDVEGLDPEIQKLAKYHGLQQKGSDCYAGSPDADDAFAKCTRVIESLIAGDWSTRGEGGAPQATLFSEAFERWLANDVPAEKHAALRDRIANGGLVKGVQTSAEEFRKMLRETREIKAYIATIQKERAERAAADAKGVSAGDLVEV